jgi:two-component system response regulator HydG
LTNGNREETARILGIGARTLYRKLDKYKGANDEAQVTTDEGMTNTE